MSALTSSPQAAPSCASPGTAPASRLAPIPAVRGAHRWRARTLTGHHDWPLQHVEELEARLQQARKAREVLDRADEVLRRKDLVQVLGKVVDRFATAVAVAHDDHLPSPLAEDLFLEQNQKTPNTTDSFDARRDPWRALKGPTTKTRKPSSK